MEELGILTCHWLSLPTIIAITPQSKCLPMKLCMEGSVDLLLCWDEVGEKHIEGPELIRYTSEKVPLIQERLKTAFSRQKSYADPKRKNLQFSIGDFLFLKISPMKGVLRFGKRGKLSPRFIGPFEILSKVGEVSYKLALPPSMDKVHPVFHISMLRKYVADPSHVLQVPEIDIQPDLSYEESPTEIVD